MFNGDEKHVKNKVALLIVPIVRLLFIRSMKIRGSLLKTLVQNKE